MRQREGDLELESELEMERMLGSSSPCGPLLLHKGQWCKLVRFRSPNRCLYRCPDGTLCGITLAHPGLPLSTRKLCREP
jgi:hypothetical protein